MQRRLTSFHHHLGGRISAWPKVVGLVEVFYCFGEIPNEKRREPPFVGQHPLRDVWRPPAVMHFKQFVDIDRFSFAFDDHLVQPPGDNIVPGKLICGGSDKNRSVVLFIQSFEPR